MSGIRNSAWRWVSRGAVVAPLLLMGGLLTTSTAAAGEFSNFYSQSSGCNSCGGSCSSCGDCGWCDLGDPWKAFDENDYGVEIGGWTQFGYTSESTGMFNSNPDRVNLHQGWLFAEKVADGSDGVGFGFRADLMYGTDANDTQAFGNNPGNWDFANGWDRGAGYGWAMPQFYAEIASGDLSVKLGHFFTLVGYEVVPSTGNFFFSHAMTMYNSEPFTHTGALATYKVSDNVEAYGGWTLGWDTGFDQFGSGSSFLGGAKVTLSDSTSVTYINTIGDMGVRGDGYSHSVVLDVKITEKLNYVFQTDLVSLDTGAGQNDEYGVNQYLFYTVNDCFALGSRLEWWNSDAGFDHGGQSLPAGGSHSYQEVTFGANVKPHANVMIRPEWRYDWFPHANYDQHIFGIDAIFTF